MGVGKSREFIPERVNSGYGARILAVSWAVCDVGAEG